MWSSNKYKLQIHEKSGNYIFATLHELIGISTPKQIENSHMEFRGDRWVLTKLHVYFGQESLKEKKHSSI